MISLTHREMLSILGVTPERADELKKRWVKSWPDVVKAFEGVRRRVKKGVKK